MPMWGIQALANAIVGKTILAMYWDEDRLVFDTTNGLVGFNVDGDCCSSSYFYDFYGVRNLLDNGPVTAFEEVTLSPGDPGYRETTWDADGREIDHEHIQVYGYRFTTVHPMFGEVSSVLSFRNASNGYYGGEMHVMSRPALDKKLTALTEDVTGA
jgi:hypothetical protein